MFFIYLIIANYILFWFVNFVLFVYLFFFDKYFIVLFKSTKFFTQHFMVIHLILYFTFYILEIWRKIIGITRTPCTIFLLLLLLFISIIINLCFQFFSHVYRLIKWISIALTVCFFLNFFIIFILNYFFILFWW